MIYSDILIVGAGVVGCAVARELSRYEASITVLDRACDVAEGATKANTALVHAGFDAKPGSLKAITNVRGAAMFQDLCDELGVSFGRNGALVVGFEESDRQVLEDLLQRGKENGVDGLEIISGKEALELEPNLNPEICCALNIPSAGITSPYELTYALADNAAVNGARFRFNQEVTSVSRGKDGLWHVLTNQGHFTAKIFINCAGEQGAVLHNMISDEHLEIIHRRGQYYLLDRMQPLPFIRTVFQCPTKMGKGVVVSPTVHGNMIIGPTAEDIEDGQDVSTTAEGLNSVVERASLTWPGMPLRSCITNFSGIRAHEKGDDFVIGAVKGAEGAYEAIGIESPGLSAAPAIGEMLSELIVEKEDLKKKYNYTTALKCPKPFNEMSAEEQAKAVEQNPLHGNIICRCETITEEEIRRAIRRPVGATTVDGVKRRARAGMGRCQGGFCSPRVIEILSEELNLPKTEITKGGGQSYMLTGNITDALKGVENNA
jgi:glycerol-3-phosphate dehydrogenase